jgi:hypothetical protein
LHNCGQVSNLLLRLPSKQVRERFIIVYELEGCQEAVNFLAQYYGIKNMKIILNGRKVGKRYIACYFRNIAYFTKRGLNKRTVLHEFYHHLVYANKFEMSSRIEEQNAHDYVRDFLKV